MKRILIVALAVATLILSLPASAESIDLTALTKDELVELRTKINAELLHTGLDSVVYEDDYIKVSWKGIVRDGGFLKTGLAVSNISDENLNIDLDTIAINGYEMAPHNGIRYLIEQGLSLITSLTNGWIIPRENWQAYGIETIDEIYIKLIVSTEEDRYTPLITVPINISLSHEIAD